MLNLKNSAMFLVAALCGYLALMTPDWKTDLQAAQGIAYVLDTDGDGDSDHLWQHKTTGDMTVWHQQGFAHVGGTFLGGVGSNFVLADSADLDADSDSDLILFDGDPSAGLALRWEMENNAKISGAKLAGFPGWQFKGTGDVDGDGDGDIFWQSENGLAASDGTVILWIMENNAKVTGTNIGRHEFGGRIEVIGDFDNDGDADILQSVPSGSALVRWDFENGSKVAGASIGGFPGYHVIASGDFNKDGSDDIMWEIDTYDSTTIMWPMINGDKGTGKALGTLNNYVVVTAGDYDGDLDNDILWKNAAGQLIYWEIENLVKVGGVVGDVLDADHAIRPSNQVNQ